MRLTFGRHSVCAIFKKVSISLLPLAKFHSITYSAVGMLRTLQTDLQVLSNSIHGCHNPEGFSFEEVVHAWVFFKLLQFAIEIVLQCERNGRGVNDNQ